jgi:tRNA(fMet)-specific endonuclease VapC
MPQYMLDTDISSYFIHGGRPGIDRRMEQLKREDTCISFITKGELLFGVAAAQHQGTLSDKMSTYLRYMQVLELTDGIALEYANIRADLKRRGLPIGSNDLWIAAHARHLGLTLVTNNVREFSRVPGLKIENWADEVQSPR